MRSSGGFVRPALALAVTIGLVACGPRGRAGSAAAPASDSAWLASVGFPLREPESLLHLTATDIAALRVDSIAQLLEQAEDVEVRLRRDGRKDYLLHRTSNWLADPGCPLDFYINGNLLQVRAGPDVLDLQEDRLFDPRNLTGLEIFSAADAPVGGESACGVVLFWVRRLRHRDDPPFTAALTGRIVRQPGNQGVAGVTVKAEPGGLTQVTNADGRFSFGAVPAAIYTVEADVPDWGKYRTEIGLRSNGVGDVTIEVERR
jgi:hypothetical protein